MEQIALIGCSKTKLAHAAPARDLYQGPLFRLSVRYAEKVLQVDRWFVLSALLGLVHPDQILAPYERTLARMKAPARRAWAQTVLSQLQRRGLNRPDVHWHILAGQDYWWYLVWELQGEVERPLYALGGYGKIIHWLEDQVDGR